MMGRRMMAEPLFHTFRLEDHVPGDHLLRAVDALLDTAFVRRVMAPHYSRRPWVSTTRCRLRPLTFLPPS